MPDEMYIDILEELVAKFFYQADDESFLTEEQRKIAQKCFNKHYPNYNGSW